MIIVEQWCRLFTNNLVLQKGMWWPWSCSINCKKLKAFVFPSLSVQLRCGKNFAFPRQKSLNFASKSRPFGTVDVDWIWSYCLWLVSAPVNSHLWQMGVTPWTYRLAKLRSNPTITKDIHNTLYNGLWIQKLKKWWWSFLLWNDLVKTEMNYLIKLKRVRRHFKVWMY